MKYKKLLPSQIFIIFEHMPVIMFTSTANSSNHYNLYVPQFYINQISVLLSFELTLNNNYLVDMSSLDFQNTNQVWILKIFKKISKNLLIFMSYYLYWAKIRLTLFSFLKKRFNKYHLKSIETFFFNANWLEREVSEMFGIYFFKKNDSRNLLLEYSSMYNPMLKNFPCEGYYEVYYNLFNSNVSSLEVESVEL